MRTIYLFLPSTMLAFLLASCTSTGSSSTQAANNLINRQTITLTTPESYPAKNPKTVAIYTPEQTPHTAYRVIGIAKVSKFNLLGMQRQDTTVNEMMKNLAASVGGDGLINVSDNDDHMEANIIAFQKILI